MNFKVILTILALFPVIFLQAQDDWKLKKDDEGIKIYTRLIEGSNFKEYKAIAEIEADVAIIAAVIKDIDRYPEWISNASSVELIDTTETMIRYYLQTDIPSVLVRDRDLVNTLDFQYAADQQSLRINIGCESHLVPKNEDFVRITKSGGYWLVEKTGNQKSMVTIQIHTEPNGSIPSWLVNSFVVDAPFNDLQALKERVKMEIYTKTKYSYLEN